MHGDWFRLISAELGVCTSSLVWHQSQGRWGLIILIGVNSERHGNSLSYDARLIAQGLALHTMCNKSIVLTPPTIYNSWFRYVVTDYIWEHLRLTSLDRGYYRILEGLEDPLFSRTRELIIPSDLSRISTYTSIRHNVVYVCRCHTACGAVRWLRFAWDVH